MENSKTYPQGGTRAWVVWGLATLFVVFLFNLQTGYQIINHDLKQDIGLTIQQIGLIAAVYTWVFALAQLFSGSILDKLGVHKVLPIAILTVTAGAFLLANAENFTMVILSQIVLAIGASFGFVGAGFVGGKWFGLAKFGFMFGLVQTISSLGSLVGGDALSWAMKSFDWRTIINVIGVFGIVLVIVAFIFIKNREPVKKSNNNENFFKSVVLKIFTVAKNPQIWLSALIGAALFGSLLCLSVVWGTKIIQANGIDETTANKLTLLIWLGLAVGAALADKFSNKIHSRKKAIIGLAIGFTLLFIGLLYLPLSPVLAGIIMFLLGFFNGGHMISFTMSGEMVSPDDIGTSSAITNGTMFLFGGFFIDIPGKILVEGTNTITNFQHAMLPILITIIVIIIVNMIFLKETWQSKTTSGSELNKE
ncbi:MAG: MFS transporter [Oceanihabitans sp.]|nr:MFS transporter [Oceanihabitans sp.]